VSLAFSPRRFAWAELFVGLFPPLKTWKKQGSSMGNHPSALHMTVEQHSKTRTCRL
jgi:hypothetical protein